MPITEEGFLHGEAELAASALRTTVAIRERATQLLRRARKGESPWFMVDDASMDATAAAVIDATRRHYGQRPVPLRSRWRHFEAGGVNRRGDLLQRLGDVPLTVRAHSLIDLTVVSVLLDGDPGADWRYTEAATGETYTHSEGLAVATFHAFMGGLFSGEADHPLQADSTGLRALVTDHLAAAFQVTPTNPLPALEERAVLLRRLGEVIAEQPEVFGDEVARPGGIFDMLISPLGPDVPHTADVAAHDILSQVLVSLSALWPLDNTIGNVALGDCWRHPAVRGEGLTDGWVPLHQIPQWMTYSLLEPFEWSAVKVRDVDLLTALPDMQHGGLLLDTGLLALRDEAVVREVWKPGDEIIVEWRALTVALMDEVADAVRRQLELTRQELPLARIMEGGSWAAGRDLALRHRDGLPPLAVEGSGMFL